VVVLAFPVVAMVEVELIKVEDTGIVEVAVVVGTDLVEVEVVLVTGADLIEQGGHKHDTAPFLKLCLPNRRYTQEYLVDL
jgi:hypothetical protein